MPFDDVAKIVGDRNRVAASVASGETVRSGNVNSLQLALLVALVGVSARRRFTGNAWVDGLFVGALAATGTAGCRIGGAPAMRLAR